MGFVGRRGVRLGVDMIFLYNVTPLFFTLLILAVPIFKTTLTVLIDSGMFSLPIVILGIAAFSLLSSALFFSYKMLNLFLVL